MKILQTRQFKQATKKLHKNQKKQLDQAIMQIINTPDIGTQKKGDLHGVRVYKFKMMNQLTLVAYIHDNDSITLV